MPSSIFSLMDFSAFPSVWYWVLVGLTWTRLIHAPIGIPRDLVRRAQHGSDTARRDVEALADVVTGRSATATRYDSMLAVALWAFALTAIALLAVVYGFRTAEALLLLAAPLALVHWLGTGAKARIRDGALVGNDLLVELARLGWRVQIVGLLAVFISSLWGMYRILQSQFW